MLCTSSCLTKTPQGCGQGQAWTLGRRSGFSDRRHAVRAESAARCVQAPGHADACRAGYRSAQDLCWTVSRSVWSERRLPQMVEQLVDVPTVLSYTLLQQRTAEQLVNTPRLGGRRFLGSLPGQVSTASVAEQTVDIPVPGRGGFRSGDQQGFLPVHNPSAQSAEHIVGSSVHVVVGVVLKVEFNSVGRRAAR